MSNTVLCTNPAHGVESHIRGSAAQLACTASIDHSMTLVNDGAPQLSLTSGSNPEVLAARIQAAQNVLDDNRDVEFLDHSSIDGDYVTFDEMSDSAKASNNCSALSDYICEYVSPIEFEANSMKSVTMQNQLTKGVHVAILLEDDHGEYIVDYTARQYGQDLPFPMVTSVNEWRETITKAADHGEWDYHGEWDQWGNE